MSLPQIQTNFSGGVLSPELSAHVDLAKTRTALSAGKNAFVQVQGGAVRRPGTRYVGTSTAALLIPFTFNVSQTYILEFGDHVMRVISDGGYVLTPAGTVYHLSTPWPLADVTGLHWVQSADVITLTHPAYPPVDLVRYGNAEWLVRTVSFEPTIQAPVNISVTTNAVGTSQCAYVVTAIDSNGQESRPSVPGTVLSALRTASQVANTISWSAVTGAVRYKVYMAAQANNATVQDGALYGYIGQTTALIFQDNYITQDYANTPPQATNPWGTGEYPTCSTYHEGRRWFAGSTAHPLTCWASQSGTNTNFDVSQVVKDSDAITFTLKLPSVNRIHGLVSATSLMLMTSACPVNVTGSQERAITTTQIMVIPQTSVGCADIPPVVVNRQVVMVEAAGSTIGVMTHNPYANIWDWSDLTQLARHYFVGQQILRLESGWEPHRLIWALRDDGIVLCLTYEASQQVYGWTDWDFGGTVKSMAVIREHGRDALYILIDRMINGSVQRLVERVEPLFMPPPNKTVDWSDCWFADCAAQYQGAPATVISGLEYLNGETVCILADGAVIPAQTVTNGTITVPAPARVVLAGLPYTTTLTSMRLALPTQTTTESKRKRLVSVALRMMDYCGGAQAGQTGTEPTLLKQQISSTAPVPASGDWRVRVSSRWDMEASLTVLQDQPLPLKLLGIIPDLLGGDEP